MSPGPVPAGAGAPAPARYSERQVRCLEAMGLTAWVVRDRAAPTVDPAGAPPAAEPAPARATATALEEPGEPTPETSSRGASVPEAPAVETVRVSVPSGAGPAGRSSPPAAPDGAAARTAGSPVPARDVASGAPPPALSARRLRAFERRGRSVFETNPEGGRVLVPVERAAGAGEGAAPPLDGEPAALFRLMLRSIGLGPGDVSLCALDVPRGDDAADDGDGPAVRELLGGERRTLLWLVPDAALAGPVEPDAALRALGAVAVAVPHPALLLARPTSKREAWAALKAVRRRLAELGPADARGDTRRGR